MTDTVVSWSTHRPDRRSWVWDAALTVPLDEPKPLLFFSALTDADHTVRSVSLIERSGEGKMRLVRQRKSKKRARLRVVE